MELPGVKILQGDCLTRMSDLADGSVQACVTSPPYFGLRDYGNDGQIGQERSPDEYVAKMVEVFHHVRRVLSDDGTLWLNLGDSYGPGKQLFGMPWRVALALQADGWVLRQDIIWHKPNPMPESVRDRCTKAHEYVFLLSKSERYFYDSDAVKEPAVSEKPAGNKRHKYADAYAASDSEEHRTKAGLIALAGVEWETRNRRSVWSIATKPYKGAHFAVFPPALVEPCILAGSRPGDVVLDPFNGSGTTGQVAIQHGRRYVGCELNPEYVKLTFDRLKAANDNQCQLDLV